MAELLAPAGNIEALDAAVAEGADAVYMGLKSFNARLRSSNFSWNQFEAAVSAVHRLGKKIFVTVNTVMEEQETERMYRFLTYLDRIKPDGLIVQDFGVVRMVQEFFPGLRLHASTQMNIACAKGANAMSRSGIRRVVLARELGLEEIRQIRERTNVEMEVFVHGALCVSESGLCLFSSFLGGKSANRGMCTQACRRLYEAEASGGAAQGYFFSPHDLQLVDRIPDLVLAGVDSFKIEGRMKSAEYVGSVTAAYRYVLDHWEEDREGAVAAAKRMLSSDFARAKTLYWYDSPSADNLLNPDQAGGTGICLGKIERLRTAKEEDTSGETAGGQTVYLASLKGGNYDPEAGDSIRLHKKDDSGRESHKVRYVHEKDGRKWTDVPPGFSAGDSVYLIQTKSMSKRYPHVLPADLSRFRSQPGGELLPEMDLTPLTKEENDCLPEGIYIQVSTIKDLFAVQSEAPDGVILELNSETRRSLTEKKEKLPFSRKNVIISLDPFCPQEAEDPLSETIEYLVSEGFSRWIVNNPAHIGMLRGKAAVMIAGPYLYTFNRWAVSWTENQDISFLVTPLENSRRNAEKTFRRNERARVFVSLFAYPALFRMRFRLPEKYDFTYFSDRQNTVFKALSTEDGSFVLPENPFSIVDKVSTLNDSGFSRFIVDLSKTAVRKNQLKQIMDALRKGRPLPETDRFNWKDGFYSSEKVERLRAASDETGGAAKPRGKNSRPEKPSARRSPSQVSPKGRRGGKPER